MYTVTCKTQYLYIFHNPMPFEITGVFYQTSVFQPRCSVVLFFWPGCVLPVLRDPRSQRDTQYFAMFRELYYCIRFVRQLTAAKQNVVFYSMFYSTSHAPGAITTRQCSNSTATFRPSLRLISHTFTHLCGFTCTTSLDRF